MDAFFASVEERDKPRLKGLPIVVGSDPANGKGRGVVATANYAARKYGIKSAMPISRAWELSQQAKKAGRPEVVFMEGDFRSYGKASREVFDYIATQGEAFEPASIDECYLETHDLSWEQAEKLAQDIQEYVQQAFGLSCSVGVGPNKLISKIAAGRRKPHGLMVVRDEEVPAFLDPLSVRELMGIGPKTGQQLRAMGIETVVQLRQLLPQELVDTFGKNGEGMYRQSRGIDDSPVEAGHEAKSIGSETTFDRDTLDASLILPIFKKLAVEVAGYLKKGKRRFKTVSIVVRFADFETRTRSFTLPEATDDAAVLESRALLLLVPFFDSRENPHRKKLRLVGIRAEKLA
jgi:DNA polymerase IV (archaeal DinB-like DNA polymerase)